jgi:capsular exopolysaccharide synthesis family protein
MPVGCDLHVPSTPSPELGMSIPREPNALTLASSARAVSPSTTPTFATPLGDVEPAIPWTRYLSAIWRYKWLVVLLTFLGAAGSVVAIRRIRPSYEVHATLWLSTDPRQGSGDGRPAGLVNNSSWIDLLRSYAILERVAHRAGMDVYPAKPDDRALFAGFAVRDSARTGRFMLRVDTAGSYALLDPTETILESGSVGDSIGRSLGFSWRPLREQLLGGSEHAFTVQTPRDAANDISARLTTVQPEGTSFIRLTLSGSEPKATAALLNMITEEFIAVSTELKKRSVVAQSTRLEDQARSAERSLRSAESALERFRVASITLPSDAGGSTAVRASVADPMLGRYLDEKTELDGLQRDRATIDDAVARMRGDENAIDYVLTIPILATRAPELRAAVLDLATKRAALQTARLQYTDEHKVVRDLREGERQLRQETIPRLAAARSEQMARRERELQSSVMSSAQSLQGIPPRALEELRLRRNVTLAENLFAKVENEYESAGLAEAGMVADVSVLDPAVAPVRAPNSRATQLAALFTTMGGFSGVFFALLLDASDKRLRYRSQVGDDIDLFVLGSVPQLRHRRKTQSLESAQLIESLRSIRMGIAYAVGGKTPLLLTITSPNVGDGKSFVSANLAISCAEAGQRTLLIDGDIRRGVLHDMFGAARRPGLLDCLATDLQLQDAIVATEIPNLALLPSGTWYRQGPELLAGPGFSNLINEVKAGYDVIIVDSSPLGVGSDALWESVATGVVAIILRMNSSDRTVVKSMLEVLDRLPVQIVGAVLNDCAMPAQNEYSEYLSHNTLDLDTDIPHRTSQVGVIGASR